MTTQEVQPKDRTDRRGVVLLLCTNWIDNFYILSLAELISQLSQRQIKYNLHVLPS
jgi:hypothetical protein